MAQKPLTVEQMQEAVNTKELYGTIAGSSKLGLPISTLNHRVKEAKRLGIAATCKRHITTPASAIISENKARFSMNIQDGIVLVGSDAHYWPSHVTTAHRAFVRFCRELKPVLTVMNGDLCDFAQISRFQRIGWDKTPTVKEELVEVQTRLSEIVDAFPGAQRAWPLGNHDARFETRLANESSQFEGLHGFHLKDHFSDWHPCWGVWINEDVCIKHRWKGGIHATYQNTLQSGVTLVTGHLHSLQVRPYTDYRGTRYGVDTGTLAEPGGPQFTDYTEDGPKNWRSGFVVLTFWQGRLLTPEMVTVIGDGLVDFRGQAIEV